jgi:hypothetical protein
LYAEVGQSGAIAFSIVDLGRRAQGLGIDPEKLSRCLKGNGFAWHLDSMRIVRAYVPFKYFFLRGVPQ